MRPGQQNNKNRSRGRGNNNGGRKHQNPLSRSYESNGPDVKIRGNAAHIAEKYQQLARDAHASGDSVMAENYLQHAEHYFRILSAAQPQGMSRPDFNNDSDNDDDDTEEMNGAASDSFESRGDNDGNGGRRDNRPRRDENQPRIERPAFVSEISGGEEAAARPQPSPATDAPQPGEQATEANAADGEQPSEPKRPRRPRRRRTAGAEGDAGQGDAQPGDAAELPAFLTAGGTAAE